MEEIWKDIEDYEGLYQVSNLGRVRSFHRHKGWKPGGVLKEYFGNTGYIEVTLWKNGKKKTYQTHFLVARAFLSHHHGDKLDTLHGPNGKKDNSIGNLSLGTRKDNMNDQKRDGTNFQANKKECKRGHTLREPNLIPSDLAKGIRRCRSCANAKTRRNKDIDFDTYADMRYQKIMSLDN